MLCENCNQREGTEKWVGDMGFLAITHGMYSMWCKLCVVSAQLEHAKEAASKIPELEKQLEELNA